VSDFGIEEDKRLRKLAGETVRSVDVQAGKDRVEAVTLMFENGASITVSFFAVYADDAGLVFTLDNGEGGTSETRVDL
jgi:hypothetical protein